MKTLDEFKAALARDIFGVAPADVPGKCIKCLDPFTAANVYTDMGWRESKISGLCERCWDSMFQAEEEQS